MSDFIPFHIPDIGEEEIASLVETLRSGWLTTGPKAKKFEEEFARYLGAAHTVAVNSGTAALHLALEAIGIKEGDEVIVPTMTFTATAEVALYLKARPVLVDCQPGTLNIDPQKIEEAITPRTRAIMPVDFGGQPCDYDPILEIATRRGLKVVEDAAHALPASYKGRRVGTFSDITCFSFYATKTIATGEGGMAATANPEWAERMRMMSLHGISKDAWKRYTAEGSWYYEVHQPGYKYNLTDIAAALGLAQLAKCDRFREERRRIASRYDNAFADLPEVERPVAAPDREHAWHLYVIRLDLERLRIDRREFIEALKQRGIGASVHFIPLHLHPFYRNTFGYKPEDFPNAAAAFERILSLPIFPGMGDQRIDRVIEAVRSIAREHRR
jgi:dTDP-4-amino-4,6-dideoxygalactose transaminase